MIVYTFKFADARVLTFETEGEAVKTCKAARVSAPAFWTALDYGQCAGCPLAVAEHPHCPAALALEEIATAFAGLISHETVDVEVRTPERTVVKRTDTQSALRSLMGLKMATCGCPILGRLKGPARLHLPFGNFEETLVRITGAYLIQQYLVAGQGGVPDWTLKGLGQLFTELERINICLKRRFDALDQQDANLNAIVAFLSFSARATMSLEEKLAELAPYAVGGELNLPVRPTEESPEPITAGGRSAVALAGAAPTTTRMIAPSAQIIGFPVVRRKVKQRA